MTKALWWSVFTLAILTQGRVFTEAAKPHSNSTIMTPTISSLGSSIYYVQKIFRKIVFLTT